MIFQSRSTFGREFLRRLLFAAAALFTGACTEPGTEQSALPLLEVFHCQKLLIGSSEASCREDVIGPGVLRIVFNPDPPQGSWEVSISGLAALAESCEYHGSFDKTRLSNLQGRGETALVCPVASNIERAYHELRFENRMPSAVGSMSIAVRYVR